MTKQLPQYFFLMRLHKPIGIFLLLWPTLWALWLAAYGHPDYKILFVFIAGVILMRSAGCILNDFADRHFDKFVERTKERPLTAGKVSSFEALCLAALLALIALLLVITCNKMTIQLAFIAAALTVVYPFMKRFTNLPQIGLGVAFAWGVPMAFTAVRGEVDYSAWILFLTSAIWPIFYDTMYAMVDRQDDLNIGIKSTAILFAKQDRIAIGCLQFLFLILLCCVGVCFHLQNIYYISIALTTLLLIYQQWLIRKRDPVRCFKAFLNNNWVGAIIFFGIFAGQT